MSDNIIQANKLAEKLLFDEIWNTYSLSKKTEKVFDEFKKKFLIDFSEEEKYLNRNNGEKEKSKENDKTPEQEKTNELDEKYLKLFKKIVKLTHPDKDTQKINKDLFLAATSAKEENQWQVIVLIANKLDIEIPSLTFSERKKIRNFGLLYAKRTAQMRESHEWLWNINSEEKKQSIKEYVYKKFEIDLTMFEQWRNSNENK